MPYQGSAGSTGSDSGGSGGVVMPAQAPADLGTGAGGLMQIGQTQVAGQSGTPGANLPVDDIQQAGNMILAGKADPGQTMGAENRLDGFDGVGGGGGGGGGGGANGQNGQVAASTANENTSSTGLGGQQNNNGNQSVNPASVTNAGNNNGNNNGDIDPAAQNEPV